MAKNPAHPHKTRYAKINALLKRKLIRPAMPSNALFELHELRSRRHPAGLHLSQYVDDIENPDGWWDTAGKRIRQTDLELNRAGALLHELMTHC